MGAYLIASKKQIKKIKVLTVRTSTLNEYQDFL